MRGKSSLTFEALMDGGVVHQVVVDQRDFAKWEGQPFRDDEAVHTKLRFLVWSAMRRQSLVTAEWPVFNETLLVETSVADDGEEGEQGLDPGNPTMSATP